MKRRFLCMGFILLCFSLSLFAKEVQEFYPDGKLKFKGSYVYTWAQDDYKQPDLMLDISPGRNYRSERGRDEISLIRNISPSKLYDGHCSFYFPNGKIQLEGDYSNGVPDGAFNVWGEAGNKLASLYFKNGTADGNWIYWEADGTVRYSFSYKEIPQDYLGKIYSDFYNNADDENDKLIFEFMNRKEIFKEKPYAFNAYETSLSVFANFMESALYPMSIWDGKFIANRAGQPYLEFYFDKNKPSGTWKIWKDSKLAFECRFNNGLLVSATDYANPETNKMYSDLKAQEKADSIRYAQMRNNPPKAPRPVDAVTDVPKERIFTAVEQMPEYPGGVAALQAYLANNLKYPVQALENKIEGNVVATVIIRENGMIDTSNIKISKDLGYGTKEETIRLVKSMPAWKPGKQNGQAVKVYYTFMVPFKEKEK